MFLFVLKRDKICFGGILDNFCYSVQSVVGWNLGGAFLVVIFPMKSGGHSGGGHFFGGGTLGGGTLVPPQIWVPPPDNYTMLKGGGGFATHESSTRSSRGLEM